MAWNPRSWAMQKRKLSLLGLLPRIGHDPSVGMAQEDMGDIPGMTQGFRKKLLPGGTLHNFPGSPERLPLVPFFPHDETDKWVARPGVISKKPTYPFLIQRPEDRIIAKEPDDTDPVVRGENVPTVKPPMQKTYPNTGPPGWAPKASAPAGAATKKKGPTKEERAEAWALAMEDAQGFMGPMQGDTIPGVAPGGGSRDHQMGQYGTGGLDLADNRPTADPDAVRKRLYGIMGFA